MRGNLDTYPQGHIICGYKSILRTNYIQHNSDYYDYYVNRGNSGARLVASCAHDAYILWYIGIHIHKGKSLNTQIMPDYMSDCSRSRSESSDVTDFSCESSSDSKTTQCLAFIS